VSNVLRRMDGRVQVWSYSVGHGLLLLRRAKQEAIATRIDCLFIGTRFMCVPSYVDDVSIHELESGDTVGLGLSSIVDSLEGSTRPI
jgi:hypothetical protein